VAKKGFMMLKREKIFVFGASGHAKVVIDMIEHQGLYMITFLVDDDPDMKGVEVYGYSVIGGKEALLAWRGELSCGIVAIGSNSARMKVAKWLAEHGFGLVTVVHPSAQLARGVTVGLGSVIMAGAVINSDARIADNVIINTKASIDHDCHVKDGVHIAPGALLCGNVTVGEGSFVCAGATVTPNLKIGEHSVIGAGSTVIRDVPDGVTVVGSPARIIRHL
jgi:sugar O-acyltransferase (sialic acid O-acetyltransferase NeuD family)